MNNYDELAATETVRGIMMGVILSIPIWLGLFGIWYWLFG